jgi:D-beta-D-heptose 7-phosphate kinase/D-beta-D-heptose 1-phosphate adenosyltransferase
MLDDFVWRGLWILRPTPVLSVRRHELLVGGAGNVARNIAALGSRCIFVGVVGDDEASRILMRALTAESLIEPYLAVDPSRPTTRKVRFVSEHYSTHLLRADWEKLGASDASTENALIERALAAIPRVASVVLSDYAKGVLTPRIISAVIKEARSLASPSSWIPRAGFSIYNGQLRRTVLSSPPRLQTRTQQRRDQTAASGSTVSLAVRHW